MDKYYWGFVYEENRWQLFASDPKDATPESTGYWAVSCAFDTREEAEQEDPNG
jgi:hypothetical protein